MNTQQWLPEAEQHIHRVSALFKSIADAHGELDREEQSLLRAVFPGALSLHWDYEVESDDGQSTIIIVNDIWLVRPDRTQLGIPLHDDLIAGDWSESCDLPSVQACIDRLETEGGQVGDTREEALLKEALAKDLGLPVDQLIAVLRVVFEIAYRNAREHEICAVEFGTATATTVEPSTP